MAFKILPKPNLTLVRNVILAVLLLSFVFTIGYFLGNRGYVIKNEGPVNVTISRELPRDKSDLDFSLFWRIWDTVSEKYLDKAKIVPSEMIYGAIKGMVAAIGDPYTVFLTPKENRVVSEDLQGSFEGIGIQIGFKGTQLAVIAPLPDSPAEKEGIKAGDFIVGIKDEASHIDRGTIGISLPEAVQAIRGPKGTKVTLLILREGEPEPKTFEITRTNLEVPSVVLKFVGENESIAHLKLLKFGAETDGEWGKAVSEINAKCKMLTAERVIPKKCGIVLDLRNNPGGYLQGAVDTASEFLKSGLTVVIEESSDGTKSEFKVGKIGRLQKVGLVVLVNEGSASASEILAGALRDHDRAKIVGEKTFGKGTIQEPLELENGAGLHITTARWLTPNGTWVNEKGLEPDVKIEDKADTEKDEQLEEAIKML